jgi:NADH/NAD ratio-sensing transcriptional regulator Rex
MGKERISSQEISEYTNINATQIRRDLSAFGRFGKRGVGYRTDALLEEIRQILRTQGQHNIALVGAGRLGSAIASSPIFAEHGITVAAVLDNDPEKIGARVGDLTISSIADIGEIARERNIIVGVIAVPADSAQDAADVAVARAADLQAFRGPPDRAPGLGCGHVVHVERPHEIPDPPVVRGDRGAHVHRVAAPGRRGVPTSCGTSACVPGTQALVPRGSRSGAGASVGRIPP